MPRNNNPIPKTNEDFNVAQRKELMTGYGPMPEIWFDMGEPAGTIGVWPRDDEGRAFVSLRFEGVLSVFPPVLGPFDGVFVHGEARLASAEYHSWQRWSGCV